MARRRTTTESMRAGTSAGRAVLARRKLAQRYGHEVARKFSKIPGEVQIAQSPRAGSNVWADRSIYLFRPRMAEWMDMWGSREDGAVRHDPGVMAGRLAERLIKIRDRRSSRRNACLAGPAMPIEVSRDRPLDLDGLRSQSGEDPAGRKTCVHQHAKCRQPARFLHTDSQRRPGPQTST